MKYNKPSYITCLHPILIGKGTINERYVSCGKCSACLVNKARKKSSMITAESAGFKYKTFSLLTYCDQCAPIIDILPSSHEGLFYIYNSRTQEYITNIESTKEILDLSLKSTKYVSYRSRNCIPVLNKEDIQKFIKRYKYIRRKEGFEGPFSYFVKGEYGPATMRPHYHVCLFTNDKREFQSIRKNIALSWQGFIKESHQVSKPKLCGRKYVRKKRSLGGTNAEPSRNGFAGYSASYVCHPSHSRGIYSLPQYAEFSTHNIRFGSSMYSQKITESSQLNYTFTHSFINTGFTNIITKFSFPTSAERIFFPRCYRYATNTFSTNLRLYALFPLFKSYYISSRQQCNLDLNDSSRSIVSVDRIVTDYLFNGFPPYLSSILDDLLEFSILISYTPYETLDDLISVLKNRLLPSFTASKQFNHNVTKYHLSPSSYLNIINRYYSDKDYQNLFGCLTEISLMVENVDDFVDITPLYYNESIACPINRASSSDIFIECVRTASEETLHNAYKKRKYNDRVTHGFTILN